MPGPFDPRNALNRMLSADIPDVRLPTLPPAVTDTDRLPFVPCPIRQRTLESDSHSVPSHPVCPTRYPTVCPAVPIEPPYTVTLADPVPWFALPTTLNAPMSLDIPSVMLPTRPPTVIITRELPFAMTPTRHLTELSDPHTVTSHPLTPVDPPAVPPAAPNPAPCTVTLIDPVPATFRLPITLNLPESALYTSVRLPTEPPTVTIARLVLPPPCPTRQRTPVSDSHVVISPALTPTLKAPL